MTITSKVKTYLEKTPVTKQNNAAIAFIAALEHIALTAPEIEIQIKEELKQQRSHLKLIASENYSSLAVQLTMGNWLTDKYAEGYPSHRFYAGCEAVDAIEARGATLLKQIFGCEHAYIQPHSGADANMLATWAIIIQRVQNRELEKLKQTTVDALSPEEYERVRQLLVNQKIMGLDLASGGHLTHGYRHNISSKMMQAVSYSSDPKTGLIDMDSLAEAVKRERPLILLAGYSAYPRKLNFAKMREIADSVGAVLMTDMAHFAGLVAGKVFQGDYDPVPHSHIVTSTTHKTLRGPRGGFILCTEEFRETIDKGCPLLLGGPLPHVLAAKAVAFTEAATPEYQNYAQRIVNNAQTLAEGLKKRGCKLVSNGTDNHLVLLSLEEFGINGRQAETLLREAGITANRNMLPADANGPWYTSGIRLGTPALTTLGMGKNEMQEIADIIVTVLQDAEPATAEKTGLPSKIKYIVDPITIEEARTRVNDLLRKYPLYPELNFLFGEEYGRRELSAS